MAIDKSVDSAVLDGYFSDIADAIREKGGSGTFTPAQMPQAIEDLPGGGADPELMALQAGTASGDIDITLPEYMAGMQVFFRQDTDTVPHGNRDVTSLTIRGVKTFGDKYSSNGGLIMYNTMSKLKSINLPDVVELNAKKSSSASSLSAVLESVAFPKVTYIPGYFFAGTTSLIEVDISSLLRVESNTFKGCTALKTLDVVVAQGIMSNALSSSGVEALILRKTGSIVSLNNVNALSGTPIAAGTGYIYVPRDLIATYEAATNWTTYAAQFRAIEDYTDDHTLNGEFIMPAS